MVRDRGTAKAKSIRKARRFCTRIAGLNKKKPYKVIRKWEEFNVGTEDVEFVVHLIPGYSFDKEDHDSERGFSSVEKAISAIRNAYTCDCMFCRKPGK